MREGSRKGGGELRREQVREACAPGVALETAVWCSHVDTWRLERELAREDQFSVIVTP